MKEIRLYKVSYFKQRYIENSNKVVIFMDSATDSMLDCMRKVQSKYKEKGKQLMLFFKYPYNKVYGKNISCKQWCMENNIPCANATDIADVQDEDMEF